jgi:hypothetical protein
MLSDRSSGGRSKALTAGLARWALLAASLGVGAGVAAVAMRSAGYWGIS